MESHGKILRKLADARGLSQREIAKRSRLALSTVNRLFNAENLGAFHPSTLRQLAESIGLTYEEMMRRASPALAKQVGHHEAKEKIMGIGEVIAAYEQMSADQRRAVRHAIDVIDAAKPNGINVHSARTSAKAS